MTPTVTTHPNFLENLNSEFAVMNDGSDIRLTLVEVSERKHLSGHEQFSILFRGPTEETFGQGLFQLEHPSMGQFDVFMVPIRADGNGIYYEAVFNRLPEE